MALWGISSGGHLAALAGTTAGQPWTRPPECSGYSDRVSAVVDYYGPTDLLQMDNQAAGRSPIRQCHPLSPPSRLVGGALCKHRDLARRASPLAWVSAGDAPFFIAHGARDTIVPPAQSHAMAEELRRRGVEVTLAIVDNAGHGGRSAMHAPALRARALDFVDRHLSHAAGSTESAERPKPPTPRG